MFSPWGGRKDVGMEERIAQQLKEAAKDGKVACRIALEIANTLGCSPARVGEVANSEGIKVAACQLGCFK